MLLPKRELDARLHTQISLSLSVCVCVCAGLSVSFNPMEDLHRSLQDMSKSGKRQRPVHRERPHTRTGTSYT